MVEAIGGTIGAAGGLMAYAVRGRSSSLFGPSVYRGPKDRAVIALTFDDGPSESTPELLETFREHRARATFFQCGENVRRLPEIACSVAAGGHEIGNHSQSHAPFCFRSPRFIHDELARAQDTIREATGATPIHFRAPFGARWFGLRTAQRKLGLMGVMWTVIGLDWRLSAERITDRLLRKTVNGAILCLHDGRETQTRPDVRATVEAVRRLIPALTARGFRFATISELLCPTT